MKDLDFSKIDLIVENACLKLDVLKDQFRVKPEPEIIEKMVYSVCLSCERRDARDQRIALASTWIDPGLLQQHLPPLGGLGQSSYNSFFGR